jgi:hypothetical protein
MLAWCTTNPKEESREGLCIQFILADMTVQVGAGRRSAAGNYRNDASIMCRALHDPPQHFRQKQDSPAMSLECRKEADLLARRCQKIQIQNRSPAPSRPAHEPSPNPFCVQEPMPREPVCHRDARFLCWRVFIVQLIICIDDVRFAKKEFLAHVPCMEEDTRHVSRALVYPGKVISGVRHSSCHDKPMSRCRCMLVVFWVFSL